MEKFFNDLIENTPSLLGIILLLTMIVNIFSNPSDIAKTFQDILAVGTILAVFIKHQTDKILSKL